MRTRLWIVAGLVLLGVAIFGTRYYEVDRPIWRFLAGESAAIDPLTLHLQCDRRWFTGQRHQLANANHCGAAEPGRSQGASPILWERTWSTAGRRESGVEEVALRLSAI